MMIDPSLFFWTLFLLLPVVSNAQSSYCPTLVWNDEFSGTTLNASNWSPQIGTGCDISPDLCGWGNNELQYYRAENAVVSDGMLKIIAQEQEYMDRDFTSARIRTLKKVDIDMTQDHIRIEARIKVPNGGMGLWPAFWMLPSNVDVTSWPSGGEIDMMEYIGREPNHAHGYFHYGNAYNDRSIMGGHLFTPDSPAADFHEYAIEKKPGEISFFFDGHKYQTFDQNMIEPKFAWPFENDFHFILNVAVGGNWPGYPDESTNFPTEMQVDYVRVFDVSNEGYGDITGARHVQANQTNELYCIQDGINYSSLQWYVPDGAWYADVSDTCIYVNFDESSGYVTAIGMSVCGERRFQVPVRVEPKYGKDFAFVGPDDDDDATASANNADLIFASGNYLIESSVDGQPAIRYQRNVNEPYDTIQYNTTSIPNPDAYVNGDFKFFTDVKTTTTPECTHVLIQLEDSSKVTNANYPIGRHSRYIAYMSASREWQRLTFDFYDRPDNSSGIVDRITILFDPNMLREDVYYIRNFDSDATGCVSSCEGLPSNSCRKTAKSEAGACNDGINNDSLGYDGDAPIDCQDADCWDDPACLSTTPAPITPEPTSTSTPPPVTPAPTSTSTSAPITPSPASSPTAAPATPSTIAPTPSAVTPTPISTTPAPSLSPVISTAGASCSSNPRCAALSLAGPDCCPTVDGVYLYCCEDQGSFAPVPTPPPAPPSSNVDASCSSNPQCAALNLAGPDCCPTSDGINLYCCGSYQSRANNDPQCSSHSSCAHLSGNCCPTDSGVILQCCDNFV